MILIQPRRFLRKIYPKALWHLDRKDKSIYLTFDNGPVPKLTEWVLDELEKYKVKATFFCVGANVIKHPELFNRILDEGHTPANHSMFHTKGFSTNVKSYINEVEACRRLTGNNLFRPPYGQLRRGQYRELTRKGYRIVMWDVISYDYEKIEPEKCLKTVLNHTRNGSILVFHDNYKAETNLKYCLPRCIEHFLQLGYSFRAIEAPRTV